MPRFTYMLNSFRSGELGPKTHARTDVTQYANGLDTLQNFLPYPTGGVGRRPGFSVLGTEDNADLQVGGTYTVIYEYDRESIYQLALSYDSVAGTWSFPSITVLGTPTYASSGIALVSAQANLQLQNITATELEGFHIVQVEQVLVMTHNSGKMEPLILVPSLNISDQIKFDLVTWTTTITPKEPFVSYEHWTTLPLYVRMPVQDPNTGAVQITPGAVAGSTTLTASTSFFTADHIGSIYVIDFGGSPVQSCTYGITGFTSATVVSATVLGVTSAAAAAASDYWYESSWSPRRGWPKSVEVHDGRLIFGGTQKDPSTVWGSFPFLFGQFNRFIGYTTSTKSSTNISYSREASAIDGGVQYTIASQGRPDNIRWIKSQRGLLIGTSGREYVVNLSPSAPSFTPQSNHGSSGYPAANGFNSTFFISADGTRIYEIRYSEENGAFVSRDITNLNSDLLHKGEANRATRYKQLVWNDSFKTLFCLTTTGKIKAVTIEPSSEVSALSDVPITDATVYQIYNLYSAAANFSFPGVRASHSDAANIEWDMLMLDYFEGDDPLNESATTLSDFAVYTDFAKGVIVPFAATTTISIGSVYDGMTLTFLCENEAGDLVVYENITIASGNATLPANVVKYVAGVPYTSKIKTLTLEVGPNNLLNSQGDIMRIDRATAKLYKSWVGKYGSEDTLYDFEGLSLTAQFTGEQRVDVPLGPDSENKVVIETDQPLPLNVLGLVLRGQNNP